MARKKVVEPQEERTPAETFVEARITTDRGPFWDERPLKKNEIATVPLALFSTLEQRGWAEKAAQ